MTEPHPPETPPPEAPRPRGWIRARRAGLGATGIIVAVFGIAATAAVSPVLVAGGMVAATAAGAGVWHLPRIRKHFAHPDGRRPPRASRAGTRRPSARPGGRRSSGPGRKSPLGGRSRSGGGKGLRLPGGGKGKGPSLGKRSGKGATAGGGRKPGGSLLKRGKSGGPSLGKRSGGKGLTAGRRSAGKGMAGGRRAGGAKGGSPLRRKGGIGLPGRRRAGGPSRGPAGRRTGTGARGKGFPRRGAGRRTGATGRGTGRRTTGPGRGPRARSGTGRPGRWYPFPPACAGATRRRTTGRGGTGPRRRTGPGRPGTGRPGPTRSARWARRGPHRFARFMRRKGPARPAPKPRTFGGPAAKRKRTFRHPFRGTYRPAPATGKTKKTAHKARASRFSVFRWAAGRHPLYVVPAAAGRARRAGRWTRRVATGWWSRGRTYRKQRKARRASTRGRQNIPVHGIKINGTATPPPPPRPAGPRPRPRRVAPVSSGPAGAQAAHAAWARKAGKMLEEVNDAVSQHLGGWQPENALDMVRFFENELPGMFENLGQTLITLGQRTSSDMPLDPIVSEHMGELASSAHSQAEVARELAGSFRRAHENEIRRLEEPRVEEQLWDVRD